MSSNACRYEADLGERISVNEKNAIRHHVGHVKNFTVGRDADVLRHPLLRKPQKPQHLLRLRVDLHKRAAEFAGEDRVATIDGKIGVIDSPGIGALAATDFSAIV